MKINLLILGSFLAGISFGWATSLEEFEQLMHNDALTLDTESAMADELILAKKKKKKGKGKKNKKGNGGKKTKITFNRDPIRIGESGASKKNQLSHRARPLRPYTPPPQRTVSEGEMQRLSDLFYRGEVGTRISEGGDINQLGVGGRTWLHGAIQRNYPQSVRFLLLKGADVKIKDAGGKTALELAKFVGHKEIIRILQDHK